MPSLLKITALLVLLLFCSRQLSAQLMPVHKETEQRLPAQSFDWEFEYQWTSAKQCLLHFTIKTLPTWNLQFKDLEVDKVENFNLSATFEEQDGKFSPRWQATTTGCQPVIDGWQAALPSKKEGKICHNNKHDFTLGLELNQANQTAELSGNMSLVISPDEYQNFGYGKAFDLTQSLNCLFEKNIPVISINGLQKQGKRKL